MSAVCRYPCGCNLFPEEHCSCMDGHPQPVMNAAETLREAAAQMRGDAEQCGDSPGDFIPAVANLVNNIAGAQPHDVDAIERDALAVARAYLEVTA